jgi:hypothetical protein
MTCRYAAVYVATRAVRVLAAARAARAPNSGTATARPWIRAIFGRALQSGRGHGRAHKGFGRQQNYLVIFKERCWPRLLRDGEIGGRAFIEMPYVDD